MTNQEFFDKVWRGLKGQGFKQATRKIGGCALYVQETGFRCAVGHAAQSTDDSDWSEAAEALKVRGVSEGLVSDATAAHDLARNPEHMEVRLRDVARTWHLEVPND